MDTVYGVLNVCRKLLQENDLRIFFDSEKSDFVTSQ